MSIWVGINLAPDDYTTWLAKSCFFWLSVLAKAKQLDCKQKDQVTLQSSVGFSIYQVTPYMKTFQVEIHKRNQLGIIFSMRPIIDPIDWKMQSEFN